jgi:hypothetical protein
VARCLRCNREFTPRKAGHVFCKPRCRHAGVRRPDEPEPPSEEVVAQLFDESRDPEERVKADDWHPIGGTWAELDAFDMVSVRRRWFKALVEEGRI